ncbi:alpha/beta hydrolase [Legionella cincinnatiensis]|uniref:Hydrolase n=1 Tax=Legionella cincinnatiensis TaxID=28085 RepID=A0A378IMM1_9GAMM|nr:alpha/beta hydrolase [Legionella cincinnatiensis]KTC83055.1 hydrolase [Legionella cincinnatiensis]STX35905.1 hydrolase [Legionella cincinnatiensis]
MQNAQTFILIHGAWHASWCWNRIAKELFLKGHKVFMPDLPGHGLKNHRSSSSIGLADYVSSVVQLIQQQQEQVILVGHSMAGLVISEVAEIIPDAIRELIFVAGYVPHDQKSLFSLAQESESNNLTPFLIIDELLQEIRLQCSPDLINVFFNCCRREDAQKAMSQLQAQPMRPFTETIHIGEKYARIPKRSLVCRYDQALLSSDQLRMSREVTDNIIYLDADHAAYYSGVKQIVDELLK